MLVHFRAGGSPRAFPGMPKWGSVVAGVPRSTFSSIFHFFWDPFWEAFSNMLLCLRHSFSKCFLEGVQTLTYDDFSFVLGAFLEAFSVCFQEQVKSRFWWPFPCENYDLRLRKAPFSLLFCSLFHDAFLERMFCSFCWFAGALRTPFGHLWDHITMFFPLLIFSRFLRRVFLHLSSPGVVQMLVGG